jgi:IclR family pca regulon transcriptional regulator
MGQREIDLNLHVGSRLPAYCTSLGKVLLAYLPPDERKRALAQIDFARRGPNTLLSESALAAELRQVRSDGFAINNEELAYGLRSIAAPVFAHDGQAVAAVNLAVHRTMVSMNELAAGLSSCLRRTAETISEQLGYRP